MRKEINDLIEDTINSMDSIKRVEASPFFSKKLSAKLYNSQAIEDVPSQKYLYIIATSLFLSLFANTLILKQNTLKNQEGFKVSYRKESFSDLYNLNTNSTYYYDDFKKK